MAKPISESSFAEMGYNIVLLADGSASVMDSSNEPLGKYHHSKKEFCTPPFYALDGGRKESGLLESTLNLIIRDGLAIYRQKDDETTEEGLAIKTSSEENVERAIKYYKILRLDGAGQVLEEMAKASFENAEKTLAGNILLTLKQMYPE